MSVVNCRSFVQGYVCAVATLMRLHDEPSYCEELLNAAGPINWRQIDQYDKDGLKQGGITLGRFAKGRPR